MKKLIFKNSLIWMLPLAIYIFEIVFVCVTGPSLVNNICAWVSCIAMFLMVAIPSIVRLSKSQHKLKQLERDIEEHWKNYNDLVENRKDKLDDYFIVETKIEKQD